MNGLHTCSVSELRRLVETRDVSPVEIVSTCLDRISSVNPNMNAVIHLRADEALKEARDAEAMLSRGAPAGHLHGIPFTTKDVIETAGVPTTLGVPEMASNVPDRDATAIRRLKGAGAILLGKTNCPPWGGGLECSNELFGRTSNPYDLARTPGGSSGGEAAAIASGMSPCGIGSDSGGSLRLPAHFCGIATIKPTAGLVPITGMVDDIGRVGSLRDPRSQIGPLARCVDDVALLLDIIAGPDGIDGGIAPVPLRDYGEAGIRGCRVALQYDNKVVPIDDDSRRVITGASGVLTDAGMHVIEQELPDEGYALTQRIWQSYGMDMHTDELYRILQQWDDYRSSMLTFFADFDLILRPVYSSPAPVQGHTDTDGLYTVPFSLTGWPAVTVPAGWTSCGLPIGVQVIAHPWRDDLALAVAKLIEQALGGWQPPATWELQ